MTKLHKQALPVLVAGLYFLLVHWTMGLRTEHLLLTLFILACYYLHPKSRRFVLDFIPFVFFGILYDFLRIYPKAWAGPIHVAGPYRLEQMLFGFDYGGRQIIPSDFFKIHHHPVFDFVTGIAYSLHMVIPLGFAFLTWIRRPELSRRFIRAFLIANIAAFITYVAFPVAPPWYIEDYGLGAASWAIPASAAGLIRFDEIIGTPYFQGVYAKSAWVHGAIPSMHGGFPFLLILFARKFLGKSVVFFYLYMALIWFSAVYLRHHYVVDLILGALYVWGAYWIVRRKPVK